MTRDDIIAEGRSYLGVPWRHRGRSRTGVDCIGFIAKIGDAFGVEYQDIDGYSRNPDGRFVDHVMRFMTYREPQTLAPGCVVVLRDQHQACHIGLIVEKYDRFYLLHASLAKRAVVEEEWDQYWQSKFRCALDYPGVED